MTLFSLKVPDSRVVENLSEKVVLKTDQVLICLWLQYHRLATTIGLNMTKSRALVLLCQLTQLYENR